MRNPDGERRASFRIGPAIAVLVAAILGGVVGGVIVHAARSQGSNPGSPGTSSSCSATTVAQRDLPSVVTIKAVGTGRGATGSGSVIDSEGHILTNNHVIAAAATGGRIEVAFNDGETTAAKVIGRDPSTDLAVLRVEQTDGLHPIALGDTPQVRIGAPVIALGAPLGLSNTVTAGIVSALDRTVSVPGEGSRSGALLVDAIQTDASINPGNSGGALVDCAGKLIGVPSAGAAVPNASGEASAGSVGIGFAIPVALAKVVAGEIVATGKAEHAYLGMQAGLAPGPDGTPAGLRVGAIDPGGPAAQAGIQAGDLITKVNGERLTSSDQILALTLKKRAGNTLQLEVERGGATREVTLTLGRAPRGADQQTQIG